MRKPTSKSLVLVSFVLLIAGLFGCSDKSGVTNTETISGSGTIVTENRTVDPFSGIQVTGIAHVIVTQDTVQSLKIEADDNIMSLLTTSVRNGLLVVSLKNGSYHNVTVNVYASMKSVSRLECVGTADFSSSGEIHADSIACIITGTGTITLTGTVTFELVQIVGTGSIHNFNMHSGRCSTIISGSGNIEVDVSQELDAVVAGTGNIVYSGNPAILRQTISGVGNVSRRP